MAKYNARSLNLLVRVRKQTEGLRAATLAGTQREITQCTQYRDTLLEQRRNQLLSAEARSQEDFDASDVRRFYQHERHLATLTDEKDAELKALSKVEHEQRGELEDSLKARKVVEQLRDQRREQHLKNLDKLEMQQLDEAALMHRESSKIAGSSGSAELQNEAAQ